MNEERKEEIENINAPLSAQVQIELQNMSTFALTKENISAIFDEYDLRTFDQDITKIIELGNIEGIIEKLKSSPQNGIPGDEKDIQSRLEYFGRNKLEEDEIPSFCEFIVEGLEDLMLRILIVCGVAEVILGSIPQTSHDIQTDWISGLAILFAVAVVVVTGALINLDKEKKFKQLNDSSSDLVRITAKRGGKPLTLAQEEILVGDLIKIDYGNILFADGLVVEGKSLKIDESSLTGETNLVSKEVLQNCLKQKDKVLTQAGQKTINDKHAISSPLVYSGTLVKEGTGWMIVLAVGKESKNGKIQSEIKASQEDDDNKTPLEIKLNDIANNIGKFGLGAAILTLIVLAIQLIVSQVKSGDKDPNLGQKIVNVFILPIAIIVVAIPEGLPLAVTLSLAYSISKMMDEKNLVRKMPACETMGGANFVCTDKTGTLTENEMNVTFYFDNIKCQDLNLQSKEERLNMFQQNYLKLVKESVSLNLNIEYDQKGNQMFTSKTDSAFALFFESFDEKIEKFREIYFPNGMKDIRSFPFNSDRKKMSTIIVSQNFPKENTRIYMKGASEIVLKNCKYYLDPNDCSKKNIGNEEESLFENVIQNFANLQLRTICIAYKDITQSEYEQWEAKNSDGKNIIEEDEFILIGILGIQDPLRKGVPEAIEKCELASVRVIMVTGDNINTAVAIAKKANILKENDEVSKSALLGIQFHDMVGGIYCETCNLAVKICTCPRTVAEAKSKGNEKTPLRKDKIRDLKKFIEIIDYLRVVARSRPEDKYLLVLGLREAGNVVAVTGDGTNDAPALAKSDVGFAMGIQGTDIAKNVSDIILLDDNFSSIVRAIIWGRNIYENIRKFMRFQLVVNVAACALVFITSCIGNTTPLTTIQMLWVNMIMDSLGSLALATEPPQDELLYRKPYSRNESMISFFMWKHILIQSLFLLSITLILYILGPFFIYEDDVDKIAHSVVIKTCYNSIPGGGIDGNNTYLLSGISGFWDSSKKLVNFTTYPNLSSICQIYRKKNATDLSLAHSVYNSNYGGTTHLSMVFNTFVLYVLMNQINSRVLTENYNIFRGILVNKMFIVITIFEVFGQVLIVQFGSKAFQLSNSGLTGNQWGICIGFSLVTFPVCVFAKSISLEVLIEKVVNSWNNRTFCKGQDGKEEVEEEFKKLNQDEDKDKIPNPLINKQSASKIDLSKNINEQNDSQIQRKPLRITSLRRNSYSLMKKQSSVKIMREVKH